MDDEYLSFRKDQDQKERTIDNERVNGPVMNNENDPLKFEQPLQKEEDDHFVKPKHDITVFDIPGNTYS